MKALTDLFYEVTKRSHQVTMVKIDININVVKTRLSESGQHDQEGNIISMR